MSETPKSKNDLLGDALPAEDIVEVPPIRVKVSRYFPITARENLENFVFSKSFENVESGISQAEIVDQMFKHIPIDCFEIELITKLPQNTIKSEDFEVVVGAINYHEVKVSGFIRKSDQGALNQIIDHYGWKSEVNV
jgi:hypothetical protein